MRQIRKIIRNIIREQLIGSPKYYIYASPTTHFPYEEDGQEDLEAQDEIIKMATAMGMEPSKGYIATTH